VGAAIWGGCNWGGGGVYINHHNFNNFNGSNIGNGNWNHNVDHRKGVAYGNDKAAQKFNRGGDARAAQSREQFRARADQGRSQLSSMDRGQLQNRVSASDRAGGGNAGNRAGSGNLGNRPSASVGSRDIGSRSSSGFSGANYGSSSRAASSRGSSSRSSMSSGSRGGGGRGGRR
jgi:curved DNA-binding protein CbpA